MCIDDCDQASRILVSQKYSDNSSGVILVFTIPLFKICSQNLAAIERSLVNGMESVWFATAAALSHNERGITTLWTEYTHAPRIQLISKKNNNFHVTLWVTGTVEIWNSTKCTQNDIFCACFFRSSNKLCLFKYFNLKKVYLGRWAVDPRLQVTQCLMDLKSSMDVGDTFVSLVVY